MRVLTFALLFLTISCTTTKPLVKEIGVDKSNYFVCNRWQDTNKNELVDDHEFVNLGKETYNSTEYVTFVGYFYREIGSKISYKFIAPDGRIVKHSGNMIQYYPTSILHPTFSVKDLIGKYSTGEYRFRWYVDSEFMGESRATLIE